MPKNKLQNVYLESVSVYPVVSWRAIEILLGSPPPAANSARGMNLREGPSLLLNDGGCSDCSVGSALLLKALSIVVLTLSLEFPGLQSVPAEPPKRVRNESPRDSAIGSKINQ